MGPRGCPVKELTTEKLISSLETLINPAVMQKAKELGQRMMAENGPQRGVDSFYRNLPIDTMICDVSIFDNQISTLAKVFCADCGLKMCLEVDQVVHRKSGTRGDHKRVPYKTKIWGKVTSKSAPLLTQPDNSLKRNGATFKSTSKNFDRNRSQQAGDLDTLAHDEFNIEQAYSKAIAFKAFWEKLDSNGNATVDETELTAFFASKEDAKAIMSAVDWNGDKSLSFAELAWIISQRPNIAI